VVSDIVTWYPAEVGTAETTLFVVTLFFSLMLATVVW
jgi:hypothetical protein